MCGDLGYICLWKSWVPDKGYQPSFFFFKESLEKHLVNEWLHGADCAIGVAKSGRPSIITLAGKPYDHCRARILCHLGNTLQTMMQPQKGRLELCLTVPCSVVYTTGNVFRRNQSCAVIPHFHNFNYSGTLPFHGEHIYTYITKIDIHSLDWIYFFHSWEYT